MHYRYAFPSHYPPITTIRWSGTMMFSKAFPETFTSLQGSLICARSQEKTWQWHILVELGRLSNPWKVQVSLYVTVVTLTQAKCKTSKWWKMSKSWSKLQYNPVMYNQSCFGGSLIVHELVSSSSVGICINCFCFVFLAQKKLTPSLLYNLNYPLIKKCTFFENCILFLFIYFGKTVIYYIWAI